MVALFVSACQIRQECYTGASAQAYAGQVRQDAEAERLLPAAWRLEYLVADDDAGYSLASLRCG